MKFFINSFIIFLSASFSDIVCALPLGFVYLENIDASIIQEIRYASDDNFVGKPIRGYQVPRCIMTKQTAVLLSKVQQKLKSRGLSLKILDAYRPQKASNDFMKWAKDNRAQQMKAIYYPNIDKSSLFKEGYIAQYSAHTRGSTVDVTLVTIPTDKNKKPLNINMGTPYDYFDKASSTLYSDLSPKILNRRLYLKVLMESVGFKSISTEWWHFTLKQEDYPNTYFNFDVK